MDKPDIQDRFAHLKALAGPVFVLVMLVAALWFLHLELKEYSLQEFRDGFLTIPLWKLLAAIGLTLLNYAILICYDWLGIWYIRHPMPFGRVALASFLGYSVGNNFGLLFGGSTIRYRLYSTWGLSAAEIVKLLFILAITFWIGLFALSGIVFLVDPLPIPEQIPVPMRTTRPLGIILTALAAGYLAISAIGRPLRIGRKRFYPPPIGLSLAQYVVAAVDLLVAAGIVYVLLPESIDVSYGNFVGIFLLAQVAVFVTQVPGGLGVLEMMLLALLAPAAAAKPTLFAALMAYRLIFYLTPMAIGIALLAAHEVLAQREWLSRAFRSLEEWTPDIAPRIAGLLVFFCGICVVISAALPVDEARMAFLQSVFPLWFIELNYLAAGVFGVLLLLLSRGLYRRIRRAWELTIPAIVATIGFALAGSLGYVQTIVLLTAFCVIAPIRYHFHRRGRVLTEQIAWHWLIAITVVLLLAAWTYWFAYKSHPHEGQGLWDFGANFDAPRSLRALLAAFAVAAGYLTVRLLQISIGRPEATTLVELRAARSIVATSPESSAHLALQGDKRLLFNEGNTALVAWSIHNRSCVAAGNPVGPVDDAVQIAWDFHEMCQQQSLWPVFYLVNSRYAALYQEMKLHLIHVCDEALVDLRRFDPASPALSVPGLARRGAMEQGCSFRVVDGESLAAVLPDLVRIDAAWQKERGDGRFRFTCTYFNDEMIVAAPVAILEQADRIVGFATLWPSADRAELAAGMIRYLPEAPDTTLDALLVESMLWGREKQYRHFILGPAPLAEWYSERHQATRPALMSIALRMGRHFYSYQGLRNYMDRFQPAWQRLFLAWPGDKPLTTVINDVAALVGSADQPEP